MRIIGEFDNGETKITVFVMNEKVSIKFERDRLEIIHKFRDGAGVQNESDAREYCDDVLMSEVEKCFDLMSTARMGSLVRKSRAEKENEWDEIV